MPSGWHCQTAETNKRWNGVCLSDTSKVFHAFVMRMAALADALCCQSPRAEICVCVTQAGTPLLQDRKTEDT